MIDSLVIDIVLLFFLLAICFTILRLRDLFAAVMLAGIMSLISASLFTLLDAVDVAFTEAAVGAGISTVLMVGTLALTRRRERERTSRVKWVPLTVSLVLGGLLFYGSLDLPPYGQGSAPAHQYMAPRFLEKSMNEVGPPNIVTSVLASYRGYDTFGETTVIFTAALGVLLLLGRALSKSNEFDPEFRKEIDEERQIPLPSESVANAPGQYIVRVSLKPLIPFIMLFGLYVQFHGDYGPGGGFQAGVIFAAGIILYTLLFGLRQGMGLLSRRQLEFLVSGGVLLYGSVGVASMLRGGNFLEYGVLAHDALHGQHLGILLIELGVGITVAAVIVGLFFLFAARGKREDVKR